MMIQCWSPKREMRAKNTSPVPNATEGVGFGRRPNPDLLLCRVFTASFRLQNLNFGCTMPRSIADVSETKMIARLLSTSVAGVIAPAILTAALFTLLASPLGVSEALGFECGVSPAGDQRCGCIGETDCEAMIASRRCKPAPFCIASQLGTRICGCRAINKRVPSKVDDAASH